jgi:hypothetical protein
MLVHNIVDLPVDFAASGCVIFSGRGRQSRWRFSFSIQFFSQSKMRFAAGVGPRAFGFSMLLGAETIKYSGV